MKILHVLNHSKPHLDGYCIRGANIVRFQKDIGLKPVVLTSPRQEPIPTSALETIDGTSYYRTLPQKSLPSVFGEVQEVCRMQKRIENVSRLEQPDIIHAHSPSSWGFAACRAARRLGIPFVYEVRGMWEDSAVVRGKLKPTSLKYRLRRALETYVARQASAMVTISSGLKLEFEGRGIENVFAVPNGVDLNKFDGSTSGSSRHDYVTLGYIGSLYPWEGVEDLVEASAIIRKKLPSIQVNVVGGGETEKSIRSVVNKLRLGDTVRMQGRVPHDEVGTAYDEIDILIYPRRANRTTELVTPLKPLEAMAQKKPIVVSDVGGLLELVDDGTAAVFKAGDVEDLAEKCLQLATSPELCRDMGQQGYEHVHRYRNWGSIVQKYKAVYHHAISAFLK